MKRLILALGIVLVMVLTLAAPVFASSQRYYLKATTISDQNGNSQLVMIQTDSHSGKITIPVYDASDPKSNTKMWISDVPTAGDVTWPGSNGLWVLELATDSDWNTQCEAWVGYWSGSPGTFTQKLKLTFSDYDGNTIIKFKSTPSIGLTVPKYAYLAVTVTNKDSNSHEIYCGYKVGNDYWYSCISTPQTDTTFPTPELAAGVLLGSGLLGLGGFIWIRRRHSATVI
jgi:hypothetical protein